jgi:protein TonB
MTPLASPVSLRADLVVAGLSDGDSITPFAIGLLFALLLHGSIAATTKLAPPRKIQERITMSVVRPPPPPPEVVAPPPPEPDKPKPPPPPNEEPPPPPPPNEEPPPEPPEPPPVVTGISMSSTVQGSSGMKTRVGNTSYGDPNQEPFVDPKDVRPYQGGSPGFKAVRASTITREAKVLNDYKGAYPKELAEQGVEGAVVLLVEVSATGAVGSVRIAKSCGNGTLDRLAQEYMKRFRFAAAEVNGAAVDSVLRYTYRFELYE